MPDQYALQILILAGIAGAASSAWAPGWRTGRHFATWVHEAGHAIIAFAVGNRVQRIKLHTDGSGVTEHAGVPSRWRRTAVAFAGYPACAGTGAAIWWSTMHGWTTGVLLAAAALTIALSVVQRSWIGFAITAGITAATLGLWLLPPWVAGTALMVVAGFLIGATVRQVQELRRYRLQSGVGASVSVGHSDADTLATTTGIPPRVWEVLFLAVALGCVAVAGWGTWSAFAN